MTYVSNPEQPSVWNTATTDALIPVAAILETLPSHDYSQVRAAFGRMHAVYQERASHAEIDKICHEVATKLGLTSDQSMTREQFERYLNEVSQRMASWMVGVPFEEPMSVDEIARLLDEDDK